METLLLKVSVLQEFANLFSNIGETKWQMEGDTWNFDK